MLEVPVVYCADEAKERQGSDGYPEGYLVYFLIAEFDSGKRLAHNHVFDDSKEGAEFAEKVTTSLANGKLLDEECWFEMPSRYGSDYYQNNGGEQDLMDFEAEKKFQTGH